MRDFLDADDEECLENMAGVDEDLVEPIQRPPEFNITMVTNVSTLNETYTVGVPAATEQTVGDAFDDEFEGAIYGYDAEFGDWQMLGENDSLSALSAVLVVAEEDTYATLDFQSGDGPATPGQVELHDGWNLVSPSSRTT
jgi:hypothetical protein